MITQTDRRPAPARPRPARRGRRWTADEVALALELDARQLKAAAIARRLGRTKKAVYYQLSLLRPSRPYVWDYGSRFRRPYEQGHNDTQIARMFGCSPSRVALWRRENGLPSNWAGRKRAV